MVLTEDRNKAKIADPRKFEHNKDEYNNII